MAEKVEMTLYGGKYTYQRDDKGQRALRYGEPWRDLTGDGFVLSMAQEIEELSGKLYEYEEILEQARKIEAR